jgi:hypothetical protein
MGIRRELIFIFAFSAFLCFVSTAFCQPEPIQIKPVLQGKGVGPYRILFIGNSFSYRNALPKVLSKLAASARPSVSMETVQYTLPGYSLEKHWGDEDALNEIRQGYWDVVILQEQSMRPIDDVKTMHYYATKIHGEIKKIGAQTLFFMTWAYKHRPEMIEGLARAYQAIGRQLRARVAPVGFAWKRTLERHPDLPLHDPDRYHPSPHGTYLTACVFYSVLVGRSPQGLSNGGMEMITEEQKGLLQTVAWEIVIAHQRETGQSPSQ